MEISTALCKQIPIMNIPGSFLGVTVFSTYQAKLVQSQASWQIQAAGPPYCQCWFLLKNDDLTTLHILHHSSPTQGEKTYSMYRYCLFNSASKVFSLLLLLSTSWTQKSSPWQHITYVLQDVHGFSITVRVLDCFARLLIGTLQVAGAAWQI